MKSVMAKKSLLMRRCKRKGKDICARNVLDDDERAKIVRLNEGYYIFKDIRNSPAYLAKKKKEAFAMIHSHYLYHNQLLKPNGLNLSEHLGKPLTRKHILTQKLLKWILKLKVG